MNGSRTACTRDARFGRAREVERVAVGRVAGPSAGDDVGAILLEHEDGAHPDLQMGEAPRHHELEASATRCVVDDDSTRVDGERRVAVTRPEGQLRVV